MEVRLLLFLDHIDLILLNIVRGLRESALLSLVEVLLAVVFGVVDVEGVGVKFALVVCVGLLASVNFEEVFGLVHFELLGGGLARKVSLTDYLIFSSDFIS